MDHSSPILGTTVGNSTTTLNSLNGNTFADQALSFWVETKTSDNKVYYYNSTTKETTWKRPENVRIVKYEEMVKQSTGSSTSGTYIQSSSRTTTSSDNLYHQSPVANLDLTLQKPSLASPSYNALIPPQQVNINFHPLQVQPQLRLAQPLLQQHQPILDSNQAYPQQQQLHLQSQPQPQLQQPQHQPSVSNSQGSPTKSKPVSTTPIPGTPWCIVWTDKNKVFYFNPSTKTSVWERPAELRNREDVDKMVSNNPNSSLTPAQSVTESRPSPIGDQSPMQAEKKIKLDGGQTSSTINSSAMGTRPVIAPKIVKKEVISEVEKEAARKRETIPLDERVDTFRKMLEEKEVNPASTFQKELSKIVFDPRYLLLTSNERREVFEKYCREKTEEERRKKMEKIKKATDEFKSLLNEANLTSRALYDEFHSRYSKDPRYKALERTKDREILFDDHLAMLRRKERDERPSVKSRPPRRPSPRGVTREEAEDIFHALLVEMVTDPDLSWHDAKRIMRKSQQWDFVEDLPRDWKEEVFERHVDKIYQRRREKFHQLLSETKEISLSSEWRDVRRIIRDDPRYIKFSTSDRRCEREFRDFIKRKRAIAEAEFRQLLRETKLIGKDTRRKIEESEHQHLIDIIGTLQNDKRYVILESFSEERRKILLSYIEELAAASPPDQPNKNSPSFSSSKVPDEDNKVSAATTASPENSLAAQDSNSIKDNNNSIEASDDRVNKESIKDGPEHVLEGTEIQTDDQ